MGTVVFSDAQYKVFLTATAEIRAQRRFEQLKAKGFDVNLARLLESILKAATDATVLDTSDLTIEEVVTRILDLLD